MSTKRSSMNGNPLTILVVLVIVGAIVAYATKGHWYADDSLQRLSLLDQLEQHQLERGQGQTHNEHAHGTHAEGEVVALSNRGLKNVGFKPLTVKRGDFQRKLHLPAIVVERPGRSQLHLAAPLTGIVSKIYSVTGEAVEPGDVLFEIKLTHEELVAAQRDYLRTIENLDVVASEIARLESLGEGVIAGKRVLEHEYEEQKLKASLHAESQAMLLHGLTKQQVDQISKSRKLFQTIQIHAPDHVHEEGTCTEHHPYQIQELAVSQGEQVQAGEHLAILGDHCELLIEALAFEDDATLIREAARDGQQVEARRLNESGSNATVGEFEILYLSDHVDPKSRAQKIYVRLPNQMALDKSTPAGTRFIEWQFKPGQRMQIGIPVETWHDQIVVPMSAVVDEGAESYVYLQHGDHFDQVAVHVLHREQESVVIATDGALAEGEIIAGSGAYQIHLALKNQAGGGVDPHAGHNH